MVEKKDTVSWMNAAALILTALPVGTALASLKRMHMACVKHLDVFSACASNAYCLRTIG